MPNSKPSKKSKSRSPSLKVSNCRFLGSFELLQPENPSHVYQVASCNLKRHDYRTWGWLAKEETARKAVEMNSGDMHEMTYTHVVIEKVAEGICTLPEQIQWYKWVYKDRAKYIGYWKKCKRPTESEGVVGYTIG